MSNTYVITTAGKALIEKAITGEEINFTKVEIGNGVLAGSPEDFSQLISLKMQATINALIWEEGSNAKIIIKYENAGLAAGFYVREIGLYANDPNDGEILFAYCFSSETDYLPPESYATVEQTVNLLIDIADGVGSVTAQISSDTNLIRENFLAFSLLLANEANNPLAHVIEENTIFGRMSGENPGNQTPEKVREFIRINKPFESGTKQLFCQPSAPVGWTKITDWDDNAMLTLNCEANGSALASGGSANPQSSHVHSINTHGHSSAAHNHQWIEVSNGKHKVWNAGGELILIPVNSTITTNGIVYISPYAGDGSAVSLIDSAYTKKESVAISSDGPCNSNNNTQPLYQEVIACIQE